LSLAATVEPRPEPASERGLGRPFVLVTGGKGGVGKSTVAANLALALAAEAPDGRRTLLVDLDFGLANLHVILGCRAAEERPGLADFFAGRAGLAECLVEAGERLDLLPGTTGSLELGRPDPERRGRLEAALRGLPSDRTLAVGDSAAGIGPDVLAFAGRADRVLVVTTPDPAAVLDAYGVLKALDAHARGDGLEVPTPELLVNQARSETEARGVAERLRDTCRKFLSRSPRLAGWLPDSRVVRLSVAAQEPFVLGAPESLAARSIRRLARRFAALVEPVRTIPSLKASASHVR